jgi:hypothetical protein
MPQRQQNRTITILNDKMHIAKLRKLIVKQYNTIERCKVEIPKLVKKKINESNIDLLNKVEELIIKILQKDNENKDEIKKNTIDEIHECFEEIKQEIN